MSEIHCRGKCLRGDIWRVPLYSFLDNSWSSISTVILSVTSNPFSLRIFWILWQTRAQYLHSAKSSDTVYIKSNCDLPSFGNLPAWNILWYYLNIPGCEYYLLSVNCHWMITIISKATISCGVSEAIELLISFISLPYRGPSVLKFGFIFWQGSRKCHRYIQLL